MLTRSQDVPIHINV